MSSRWVSDTQNSIYTHLKNKIMNALYSKYSGLHFTTIDKVEEKPEFPTVYVHFLPNAELGSNNENNRINAFLCGIQVNVTVSKTQGLNVANNVLYPIIDYLHDDLGFQISLMPEEVNTGSDDTLRLTFRARRSIGYDDVLFN